MDFHFQAKEKMNMDTLNNRFKFGNSNIFNVEIENNVSVVSYTVSLVKSCSIYKLYLL